MLKLSTNLPLGRRLDISIVKPRTMDNIGEPLLPSIKKLRRLRSGNILSRVFRHFFEHKKARRRIASYLPIIILATSLTPSVAASSASEPEAVIVTVDQNNLTTEPGLQYPVKVVKLTQGYHFFHPGIDLDGVTGDKIFPIMSGYVEDIQYSRYAYGNAVLLNHGNNVTSLYAHLSKINVEKGQKVTKETVIGEMGATGRSIGDHLHLEIRESGRSVNPLSILPRQ